MTVADIYRATRLQIRQGRAVPCPDSTTNADANPYTLQDTRQQKQMYVQMKDNGP